MKLEANKEVVFSCTYQRRSATQDQSELLMAVTDDHDPIACRGHYHNSGTPPVHHRCGCSRSSPACLSCRESHLRVRPVGSLTTQAHTKMAGDPGAAEHLRFPRPASTGAELHFAPAECPGPCQRLSASPHLCPPDGHPLLHLLSLDTVTGKDTLGYSWQHRVLR